MKTIERCVICGGNAGNIPSGGHYLCQERQKLELPTPNLGERCSSCQGSGTQRRKLLNGVFLPLIPSGEEIRRWFPKCSDCGGKGYTMGVKGSKVENEIPFAKHSL